MDIPQVNELKRQATLKGIYIIPASSVPYPYTSMNSVESDAWIQVV